MHIPLWKSVYKMASIHMSTTPPHLITHLSSITLIIQFGIVSLNHK